jgi:hypothetical protein
MARLSVFAVAGLLLQACAHTQVTSFRDPASSGRSYAHILVFLPIDDLSQRQFVEDRFAASLTGRFAASYKVIFPGRTYPTEELVQTIASSGADAVLLLSPEESGAQHFKWPSTETTQCTAYATNGTCTQSSSVRSGGYDMKKPWARYTAQVFDVARGGVVWVATMKSKGNAYANMKDVLESMTTSTLERLQADGVVSLRACDSLADSTQKC